jgi:hypothetical protein
LPPMSMWTLERQDRALGCRLHLRLRHVHRGKRSVLAAVALVVSHAATEPAATGRALTTSAARMVGRTAQGAAVRRDSCAAGRFVVTTSITVRRRETTAVQLTPRFAARIAAAKGRPVATANAAMESATTRIAAAHQTGCSANRLANAARRDSSVVARQAAVPVCA